MSILDAAYGYVDRCGAWPIIPLRTAQKRPCIRTGTDHAEGATIDLATIREWTARWPDMELGTPTGWLTGIVVIDVDPPDGEALLAALESEDVLGPLPRERVAQSPRGGLHIYTARPDTTARVSSGAGATSQLGRLLGGRAGVDVRADGGLVVLPPSRSYRWIADDDGPLPPLPSLWARAIMRAGDTPAPPRRPVRTSGDTERRVARARAYVAAIPPATQRDRGGAGGGQAAIWAVACRLVHGYSLDDDIARALLTEWCDRCTPPWSEREIEHTLRSARDHVTDPHRWRVEDERTP